MTTELVPPERSDEVRRYVQERAGVSTPPGPTQVLGFMDSKTKEIIGGFMFEKYTGDRGSVHTHWAGERGRWLTMGVLNMVMIYIFDQLGCDRVFGEVRASDKSVRKIDEKIGFKQVATLPGYFPDDDLVIYCLTKQECRYLPEVFKENAHG
jgi:RimJ/RimL family protein N-acetyltransferase